MYRGRAWQDRTSHHAESCQLCLHHSPSSSSERARAHPKNRQVPSQTIGSHLQSSPTWCCTRFAPAHAQGTRPDAPASAHSHIFQSLRLSLPLRSQAWVLPRPLHHPHAAALLLRGRELDPEGRLTRFDNVPASAPTLPTLPAPPQLPSIVDALTRPSAAFVFQTLVFSASYRDSSPVTTTHPRHEEV